MFFHSLDRDIEIFALFVSCMCHDLDHRGTNNSFQVASVGVEGDLKMVSPYLTLSESTL